MITRGTENSRLSDSNPPMAHKMSLSCQPRIRLGDYLQENLSNKWISGVERLVKNAMVVQKPSNEL